VGPVADLSRLLLVVAAGRLAAARVGHAAVAEEAARVGEPEVDARDPREQGAVALLAVLELHAVAARLAAGRVELAAGGAVEPRRVGEAEVDAALPAEVGAVALLRAVDLAVAAGGR